VLEGGEVVIPCEVGNRVGTVQWVKDGFAYVIQESKCDLYSPSVLWVDRVYLSRLFGREARVEETGTFGGKFENSGPLKTRYSPFYRSSRSDFDFTFTDRELVRSITFEKMRFSNFGCVIQEFHQIRPGNRAWKETTRRISFARVC